VAVVLATLVCAYAYVFYMSAGKLDTLVEHTAYYDQLAEAFRAGQLHLLRQPAPELLAAEDPYDQKNIGYWFFDATLHDGKYFIYWGPVPALLLAAAKSALGIAKPLGDQWPTLGFAFGRLIAGAWLIWLLVRRCATGASPWLAPLFVLVFGLSAPMPYFLARSAVYEASIAGGQCFLLFGLLWLWQAQLRSQRRTVLLVAAGVAWGLALGCRISLAPALGAIALVCLVFQQVRDRDWRRTASSAIALGLPLTAAVALLGWYNYARFGSVGDFGVDKQLSTMKFSFAFDNYWPNLYSYLFRKLESSPCGFPFVWLMYRPWSLTDTAFPHGFKLPIDYKASEPTMGLLWGEPWVVLALAALVAAMVPAVRRGTCRGDAARGRFLVLAVLCLAILATVPLLAPLGLWLATVRYELDVIAGWVLLAALGASALWAALRGPLRALAAVAIVALALYSISVGALLGFQGYAELFKRYNPELYGRLQTVSWCRVGDTNETAR
jgi:hypothetical protein